MVELSDDTLTWVFAAPLLASLVLFAFGRAPLLWTRLLIALVAQGAATGTAALLSLRVIERGGFGFFDVGGWAGARISAVDPTGLLASTLTPTTAPLVVAVELAGLLCVGLVALHGRHARSSAGSAAVLFATGMCALLVVARDVAVISAAFAGAGLAGFTLLVCFHPKRTEVEAAVRVFVIHRVGDALLLVGLFLVAPALVPAGAPVALETVAQHAPTIDTWSRIPDGPFAGFAMRDLWTLAAALVVLGAATRLFGFPLARDALGAPGAAVGLAHGVCFAGAALILLLRMRPLLWLSPEALAGLAVLALLTAMVAATLAVSARDVVRVDVLSLGGFASLGAIGAAAADVPVLLLASVVVIGAAVPLCFASGAVVEASGRADPHTLGGLEKKMPRTHTTRLLAGGALFGPLFAGATVGAHLLADVLLTPWLAARPFGYDLGAAAGPVVVVAVVLLLATLAALALASFRPLHLAFTGSVSREPFPPGTSQVDPAPTRTVPSLLLALPLLGVGLAHLPHGVVARLPNVELYRSPLQVLAGPEHGALSALRGHVLPRSSVSAAVDPTLVLVLVVAALAAGWLLSTIVYRGGPGRLHHVLVGGRRAKKVVAIVAGVAGGDSNVVRGVGEGAIRLSRMIATNLAPGVLDTLLRRIPSLLGFLVGAVIRFIANGSAQRGIAVAIIVLVVLLWRFSEHP